MVVRVYAWHAPNQIQFPEPFNSLSITQYSWGGLVVPATHSQSLTLDHQPAWLRIADGDFQLLKMISKIKKLVTCFFSFCF